MKRVTCAVGMAAALLMAAAPAKAQTTTAAAAPAASANAPSVNMWYVGGFAGIGAVQNVGALISAEAGVRVYRGIDVIAEAGWAQDVVTRRQSDLTAKVATYLQNTQGKPASSSVVAPAKFGMVGVRYVIDFSNSFHTYLIGEVGGASVEYQPTFTLDGSDVTGTLPTYGVTLGSDLKSTQSKVAYGGGLGVWYTRGQWFVDGGVRLLSIQTDSQATNVMRAQIGFGVRF